MAKKYEFLKKPLTKPQKLKVLRRTRELMERPGGWIKDSFWTAKFNRKGEREEIPAMCLAGACQYAAYELGYLETDDYALAYNRYLDETEVARDVSLHDLVVSKGYEEVPDFNDMTKTKKKDVLALIDERIEQLESK